MGSEDCTFLIHPDFKRNNKVSAFRDFPEGCGPCASKLFDEMSQRTVQDSSNSVTRKTKYFNRTRASAVRSFPPLCGIKVKASCLSVEVEGESPKVVIEKNAEDGDCYDGRLIDRVEGGSGEGKGVEKEEDLDSDLFGKCFTIPEESYRSEDEMNPKKVVVEEGNRNDVEISGNSGKENVVYLEAQDLGTKPSDKSASRHKSEGDFDGSRDALLPCRTVVLALMAESKCPWRKEDKRKGKRVLFHSRPNSEADIKTKESKKPSKKKKGNTASEESEQLGIWEKKDCVYPNGSNATRNKVRETLRLFQAVCRKLLQDEESKLKGRRNSCSRGVDLQAAKILEKKGKYLNQGKILGSVSGVEVGDEFQYRVELNIVGLNHQIQDDIDYVNHNGKILATSIIASGGDAEELDDSDVLIYTRLCVTGKNSDKESGNLALENSIDEKNPVRVIRCSESIDGQSKTYVYDGQYVVDTCWQDRSPDGKLVSKFWLRRIPDQPELSQNEVKKSKRFKTREGICVDDISHGKELIPICAVNTIDDETPPPFEYITRMIYPNWCNPIPPGGCDCANGCSSSKRCSCAVKNGGEIPFNYDGAIVEAKPLVYECGISCKCPPTCPNRVSQHGVKLQLEIFKTQSRGWGVRSPNSIPSGSFICEYIGELLGEDEAEERVGNDEYLFDIGNNSSNNSLWDGLSSVMPDEMQLTSCDFVEDGGFTIDAAHYGNVGRFINHSCSPNLYAQNVLYDHDDKRIPHIMLFATENIHPLQELTYDYNYKIDQVFDSEGNIKKKYCYCGSVECTGRLY